MLSDNTGGVLRTFNGLNMLYLVNTLAQFCKNHSLGWSPLEDLLLVCQRYGGQIQSVRDQLDQRAIHQNFLNTPFFARLPFEEQRRCFQILAGQTLPSQPVMNVPLPQNGHPWSQSALEVQQNRMSFYNAAPRLDTNFAHGLQNPQLVQQDQPMQMPPTKQNLPWMNLPSSPRAAEANVPSGDSRSRYRRISTYNVRRVSSGPQLSGNSSKESLHELYANQKTSAPNVPPLPQQPNEKSARLSVQHVGPSVSSQAHNSKKDTISRNPQHQNHSETFEMPATSTQLKSIPEHRETGAKAGSRSTAENTQSQEAQPSNQRREEEPKQLHIVGPNGIYEAPSPLRTQKTKTSADRTTAVYELDSIPTPPLSHSHSNSHHDIIAELSADIISAVEQIGSAPAPIRPALSDRRAVSAPLLQIPTQSQPPEPSEQAPPIPPRLSRALPPPSAALPPSLVPGAGRHSQSQSHHHHHHHHANSTSTLASSTSSMQDAVDLFTQLHSGYATPPVSDADDASAKERLTEWACADEVLARAALPPLTPAPLAVYKAYRPTAPQAQPQSQPHSRSASASPPVPETMAAAAADNAQNKKQRYYSDTHVRENLDPSILAREYQAELPQFEQGYVS